MGFGERIKIAALTFTWMEIDFVSRCSNTMLARHVLGSGKVTCCLYRGLNDVKTSETTPEIQSKLKPCAKPSRNYNTNCS